MSQEAAIQAWLPALEKQLREKWADVRETFLFLRVTRARLHEWIVRFDVNDSRSINHTGPTAIEALQRAQEWVNAWVKPEPDKPDLDEAFVKTVFKKISRKDRPNAPQQTAWYNQPFQDGKVMKPRK